MPTHIPKLMREIPEGIVCQGAIYRNVKFIESADFIDDVIRVSVISFPYVMVMAQACDLTSYSRMLSVNQDTPLKDRKFNSLLISSIVVPLYLTENMKKGIHLDSLSDEDGCPLITCPLTTNDRENKNERYHCMDFSNKTVIKQSVTIDFKHYFSVSTDSLLASAPTCILDDLDAAHISHRFSSFLSRIGLP